MGRPLKWTPEQKLPLVLSVLRGEGSVAEIGRRHRVSDVTLAKWRDAFLAEAVRQRWPMAASAGSPAERRSSRPNWRRSRPRSVRRTQNSGCGGKKGRSTRLHGPRADPQRGSAPGPPVLRPAWHPPCELVPLEERRKNASRVLAGSRRRCPGASGRQLRRNLRRLGAPQTLGPPSWRRLPGLDVLGGACPGQAWTPPAPALPGRETPARSGPARCVPRAADAPLPRLAVRLQ